MAKLPATQPSLLPEPLSSNNQHPIHSALPQIKLDRQTLGFSLTLFGYPSQGPVAKWVRRSMCAVTHNKYRGHDTGMAYNPRCGDDVARI